MEHPLTQLTFFDSPVPSAGFDNISEQLAVSFLNLDLDGSSVQAAYAGRQVPPKLSKLFQEPATCELHGKISRLLHLDEVFVVGPPRSDPSAANAA